MTYLMEALYQYAQEHLVHSYASLEPEYHITIFRISEQETAFRATLDDAQKQHYDALLEEKALLLSFEEKSIFHAGLHMAFELSR